MIIIRRHTITTYNAGDLIAVQLVVVGGVVLQHFPVADSPTADARGTVIQVQQFIIVLPK